MTLLTIGSSCQDCFFFDSIDSDTGLCRRHAPTRLRIDVIGRRKADQDEESYRDRTEGVWPIVFPADWCGDFKPVPQQANVAGAET